MQATRISVVVHRAGQAGSRHKRKRYCNDACCWDLSETAPCCLLYLAAAGHLQRRTFSTQNKSLNSYITKLGEPAMSTCLLVGLLMIPARFRKRVKAMLVARARQDRAFFELNVHGGNPLPSQESGPGCTRRGPPSRGNSCSVRKARGLKVSYIVSKLNSKHIRSYIDRDDSLDMKQRIQELVVSEVAGPGNPIG